MTDRSQLPTTTQRRIRMAARSGILVASLLIAPSESRAQFAESARIAVGTRMWVRTHDGTEGVWRFERASADSLTLSRRSHEADELLSVPWSEAERVDTMVIARPSVRRVLVGSSVGGLVSVAVVYLGATLAPCHSELSDCPAIGFVILSPAIVSLGALTGAIAGYQHRDWHWSTAWRAPKSPTPQDH